MNSHEKIIEQLGDKASFYLDHVSEKITKDELKGCLSDEDLMMKDEEIEKMISDVDQDGDGAVSNFKYKSTF